MAKITLPANLQDLPPREKARVYNDLVSQGFGETAIRNAVEAKLGKQSNGDWGALKDLASIVESTNQSGQGGAFTTNFGDENSWQFGQGAEYNEKNMIESSGAYFQRGNDVIVSDELFWNPDSPTGQQLAEKIENTQEADKRAGVVITPYAVFQGKATNQQLLDEVKRSGADFVAIDPYIGFGVPKEQLLAWTKEFVPKLNELGVGVKLVLQDFSRAGMEGETQAYNNELLQTPGISEFISFGLEDAKDLQGSPDWTSLTGGNQFQQQAVVPEPAERQVQSATAPEGLLSQGTAMAPIVPADVMAELNAAGPYDPNSEVWYFGGPQVVSGGKIYRKDPSGNIDITIAGGGPGSLQQVVSPTGELLLSTTDTGEKNRFGQFVSTALPAVIGSAILGPAGLGLLSTPAAAAVSSGVTTLGREGSIEDALKAAALAGVTAYGLDYLTASPELLEARNLASAGMSEEAIVDALINKGVSTNAAIEAASNATGGSVAGSARGLEFASGGTAPLGGVTQSSILAGTGNIASAVAPALAATALPVASATTPGLLNQQVQLPAPRDTALTTQDTSGIAGAASGTSIAPTQQVVTTSPREQVTTTTPGVTGAATGGLLTATAPTQQVTTTGTRDTTAGDTAAAAGSLLGTITAPSGQQVQIVDRSTQAQTTAPVFAVTPGQSVDVQGRRVETADVLVPAGAAGAALGVSAPATPTPSNISATDAALAALLLGGAGSLLNQGGQQYTLDPNVANAILNAPRPTFGRGVGGYTPPAMFQIAPTDVYNPFATTAPFGTGRFGGFAQPITLPGGLLGAR